MVYGSPESSEVAVVSAPIKERSIQTKIIRYLRSRGAWVLNVHGSPSQAVGIPDLLICYKGVFVAIEVKRPDNRSKLTPIQEHHITGIRAARGHAYVCRTVEEVAPILDRIDHAHTAGIWPWPKSS